MKKAINLYVRDGHQGAQVLAACDFADCTKGLAFFQIVEMLAAPARGQDNERVKIVKRLELAAVDPKELQTHENWPKFVADYTKVLETEVEIPDLPVVEITLSELRKVTQGAKLPGSQSGALQKLGCLVIVPEPVEEPKEGEQPAETTKPPRALRRRAEKSRAKAGKPSSRVTSITDKQATKVTEIRRGKAPAGK